MKNKPSKPSTDLVQKLWNYCHILRDDGMSYGDYVEQLTFLLFLKMAEEHSKPPFLHLAPLPKSYNWSTLVKKRDEDQLDCYERALRHLGRRSDLFGSIYKNALSKFRDPAKFQRVVDEIDSIAWSSYDSDVKGQAYEELLERTAAEGKAGAGQYFTPRALVDTIVFVVRPQPGETIFDPACGTGGFLLAAHRFVSSMRLTPAKREHLTHKAIFGSELVESVARLCLMNLVLHGIGGTESPITVVDSLASSPALQHDVVLANPPFGKKGSTSAGGSASDSAREARPGGREDFWAVTSNKQLNFLQHIYAVTKEGGRAAVVLPDNVLFEGGAGEIIRRELLKRANVHTLLRLPTGIFYAQGVKANVLFFDRKPEREEPWTETMWCYDFRTNLHFTLKEKPLQRADLDDFVSAYCSGDFKQRKPSERFKPISYGEIVKRDKFSLDIAILEDKSLEGAAQLPSPVVIASDIVEDLASALEQFAAIAEDLK